MAFLKKYLFDYWWIPILFFVFTSLLLLLFYYSSNHLLQDIVGYAYLFSMALLFVVSAWQFYKKRLIIGLVQLGLLVIGFFGLAFLFAILNITGSINERDNFADDLKLPTNITLEKPIDLEVINHNRLDSIINIPHEKLTFQLYNSFQPGLFEYDVWLKATKSGTLYLKAYEITNDTELSSSYLKERSSIKVVNTNGEFKRFGTTDHFTIYEGDWGKPYAARFEVWMETNTNDLKIIEANYIIEGWMR